MKKHITDLKVLLLQIRDDPRVCREEHESFARYSGLTREQIEILNVFETPVFTPAVIDGYDALFVGGGSEASVLEPDEYSFLESIKDLLQYCRSASIPVFASCFGFQLAVIAFGGEIIRQESNFEMGTIPIRLAAGARADLLFKDIPDGFLAVSVHKEKATRLPPGCIPLAYTDSCCHAFRLDGKPFWAFQFHPEVDLERFVQRLTIYMDQYTEGAEHLRNVINQASATPESNELVEKFVHRVLLS